MTVKAAVSSLAALSILVAVSCARIEAPPGGPPDVTPPTLVRTRPESLAAILAFRGEVLFQFDEVISEGSTPSQGLGTGDLERLVILSPVRQIPEVRWHRRSIGVRPREGWRPNTVYRVELRPGVTDLRNNRSTSAKALTFTTGAPIPDFTLQGKAFDWTSATPARGALIEAVLLPDSLAYRTVTDSSGGFTLGPLPRGKYLVYGVLDQNRNLRRDPREAYDTASAGPDSGAVRELWAFPRDTVGPRLQNVTMADSLTASLTFSQPLDPAQRIPPDSVEVRLLPDSTPVKVVSLLPPAVHDSLYRRPPPRADTAAAKPESLPPARPEPRVGPPAAPRLSRPALDTRLQLRLAEPLRPGAKYAIEVRGVRNVNGVASSPRAVLAVPEPPKRIPVDSTRRDSTRADSVRADTIRVPKPKKRP